MNDIKIVLNNSEQIFLDIINSETFKQIISIINDIKKYTNDYPKFIFSGVGKNWYICEKVVKTYISMSLDTTALDCTHALHGDLGVLYGNTPKILFFVSKSGTTEEMIKLAKVIKLLRDNNKISNIITVGFAMHCDGLCENSELFDYMLYPTVGNPSMEFDDRNLIPTMSINIMQMVLDYIGVYLFENDDKRIEHYKYNHLSGNNGKQLGGDKILLTL